MDDPYDLARFVTAQDPLIAAVRAELAARRKRTHWMWFVFPQLRGIGASERSIFYGIASLAEARAYLAHPVLGPRLLDCTGLVCAVQGRSIAEIMNGHPDDGKFHACMTLFAAADAAAPVFPQALAIFFAGVPHAQTFDLLAAG